jgi:hypothetical protein
MYKDYAASGILFIRVGCRKAGNLDTVNLIEIRTQKTAEEVQAYLQQYFRLGEAPFFQVLENLKAVDGGFTFEIREPYRQ